MAPCLSHRQELLRGRRGKDPKGDTHLIHIIDTKTFSWLGKFRCREVIPKQWPSLETAKTLCESRRPKRGRSRLIWRRAKQIAGGPFRMPSSQFDGPGRAQSSAVHRHAQSRQVFRVQHRYRKSLTTLPCTGINDDMSFESAQANLCHRNRYNDSI